MEIKGLQKVTLLDYPGKVACTVFTGGCNFRCPFCQNSELIPFGGVADGIPEEEIFSYLKKRKHLLDGICISGGEPLLQSGLTEFIQRCRELGYLVKLDTNGYEYGRLKRLIDDGLLDYVAMDIKSSPSRYAEVSGVPGLSMDSILQSVELLRSGAVEHEFRTTVVNELHSLEDFIKIGQWLCGEEKYFLQKFVDSDMVLNRELTASSDENMAQYLAAVQRHIPNAELRGSDQ